jgi:tetratricopeptide (TPR) repeat protein
LPTLFFRNIYVRFRMVIDIKGYRVFIASPGGLQEERRAFREALIAFNDAHAIPKGAIFLPVGWEDTLGGMGRAQSLINSEIQRCDYFVLLLWDRWGTPPSADGRYSSGTEEEFYVAENCVKDANMPMRKMAVLFKAVDPKQLSDPGAQLSRVLEFKKKLEEENKYFYETFDTLRNFERLLDRHLGEWLRKHEGIEPIAIAPSEHARAETDSGSLVESAARNGQESLKVAWQLADEGRRTEAEALFAKEVVNGESARAFLEYGRFLRRDGRLDQAMTMISKALELAQSQAESADEAAAYREKGILFETRGQLGVAEESYRVALTLNEKLKRDEGIADCLRSIGLIFAIRGDLDSAEEMCRRALAIDERLERLDGMADDYSSIGNALHARGDFARAEDMHQKALEIDERLQRPEAIAKHYSDLGNIRYSREDLAGAEELYRKALAIDERLGRSEGLADDYANLGNVLYERGDFDGAEEMHRKAVDIDEGLARPAGLADHYENLASVFEARGDQEQAEEFKEKSRIARQRSGLDATAADRATGTHVD